MRIDVLQNVVIGRMADNRCQTIEIDCGAWLSAYPQLTDYRIEVQSPGGVVYVAQNVNMQDGVLRWEITASDTAQSGRGTYQVVATGMNGERKTSTHPELIVLNTIDGSADENPPDPLQIWIDALMAATARLKPLVDLLTYTNGGKLLYVSEDGKAGVLTLGAGLEIRNGVLGAIGSVNSGTITDTMIEILKNAVFISDQTKNIDTLQKELDDSVPDPEDPTVQQNGSVLKIFSGVSASQSGSVLVLA